MLPELAQAAVPVLVEQAELSAPALPAERPGLGLAEAAASIPAARLDSDQARQVFADFDFDRPLNITSSFNILLNIKLNPAEAQMPPSLLFLPVFLLRYRI